MASPHRVLHSTALVASLALFAACTQTGEAKNPSTVLTPQAEQWLNRAKASYAKADLDDAKDASQSALAAAANNVDVKTQAARVHLARLEHQEVIRLLKDVQTTEAYALRGRAHWYSDELEAAADALEAELADANVKDEWAKAISKLARKGNGRKAFQVAGGALAPLEMPRIKAWHHVVPVEIDGEPAFALLATSRGELVLDASTRKEPSWVSLRFAERITVKDVPALTEDLSGISKELGVPVKALLGVNLLRRLNLTFDFGGGQFVVRQKTTSPPPNASRLAVAYARGGAMITRVQVKQGASEPVPVLVDSLLMAPFALDAEAWKAAGVETSAFGPSQFLPGTKEARLPFMRLGAFDVPEIPGVLGPSYAELGQLTGIDVHGALGAALLAGFRCTLTDEGRTMWIEDLPQWIIDLLMAGSTPPPRGAPPAASGSGAPPAPPAPPGSAPPGPKPLAPAASDKK